MSGRNVPLPRGEFTKGNLGVKLNDPEQSKQLWLLLVTLSTGPAKSFRKTKRHLRVAVGEDLRGDQTMPELRCMRVGESGRILSQVMDQMGERWLVQIVQHVFQFFVARSPRSESGPIALP